ncbi:MAG: phosphate ABC transporter permease PstA [Planctomycetota bacterium]
MSPPAVLRAAPATVPAGRRPPRIHRRRTSLFARGEPFVWLAGGALVLAAGMIAGLLLLVLYRGGATFWPRPLDEFRLLDGSVVLGEVAARESHRLAAHEIESLAPAVRARLREARGESSRTLVRTGNFELTDTHFRWVEDHLVAAHDRPEWALTVERMAWGRFYGTPRAYRVDGETVAVGPAAAWSAFAADHGGALARGRERRRLEKDGLGRLNQEIEACRLAVRAAELEHGPGSSEHARAQGELADKERDVERQAAAIRARIAALEAENARCELVLSTADGEEKALPPAEIVRAYPANRLDLAGKLSIYASRGWEYLTAAPREANSEGGVFPAIFGTVAMTFLMSVVVVPFGVLAALYLREYARQGIVVSLVRIAVNNLAGVPSIVFGVFGLGLFCYIVGASIDQLLFAANLPNPTYGKGGILWASLTLALLTLPVVIVATEEALAAVPSSMREGSYACGATKWQAIRRIVLPRAAPGIMAGAILAIARGAGEVAPLMVVGAVKLAPALPIDGRAPFLHPERSFMHLGFHIYDLGFQSQNSEAAKPMVYTTTLLLIAIVVLLNLAAIRVRARLRRKFHGVAF